MMFYHNESALPNVCIPFAYQADVNDSTMSLSEKAVAQKLNRGYSTIKVDEPFPKKTVEYHSAPKTWVHPARREK